MFTAPEQLVEFNKAGIDAALQVLKVSLDAAERFVTFQMDASRTTLADATKTARALTDVKDAQDYLAWRGKVAELSAEKAMGYSKGLYDIAQHTQAEFSGLVEERLSEANKTVVSSLDKAMKAAPAGADVFVAAVKSTVGASAAAVDSVTKAAKQMASFADASVKATANATAAASKPRK
jgi:phasin family protein